MSITSVDKDFDNLTITLVADFDASIERVWQLWADPRLLERWWGPPTYPATFEEHNLAPGGSATYFMTGPEGDKPRGWWQFKAVNPPSSLEFVDGFADAEGKPNPDLPIMTVHMQLTAREGGTRMEVRSVFESREQMEQIISMGAVEGMQESFGQIDALLAAA
jgi:uncharacterized protein YndB with AHSA1/START domain